MDIDNWDEEQDKIRKFLIIKNEKKPPKFIRYNIQTKLEIIHKAEILGNRATAKLYHINESSVRKMRKNKSIFEQLKNKKNIKTLNKGVKPKNNIDWIKITDL